MTRLVSHRKLAVMSCLGFVLCSLGGCPAETQDIVSPVDEGTVGPDLTAPAWTEDLDELDPTPSEWRGQFLGDPWADDEVADEPFGAAFPLPDDKPVFQPRQVLAEYFAGQNRFDVAQSTFGAHFGMHFLSTVWVNGQLWAYYIADDRGRPGIGLARSRDGIRFDNAGLVLGVGNTPQNNRMRSFPGVWYDGPGRWYLVFEMSGTGNPGSVGLATSTDGVNWVTDPQAILVSRDQWERNNVGTPSLWKEGHTWYLFYHGFGRSGNGGPDDCQVGVAYGSDLRNLKRHSGNPIIRTSSNGPDSGTIGRRSIVREGAYYYMFAEISTNQPYERARWSSGLWRATNLLGPWERCHRNPILPVTAGGFGYDGPEFIRTPDGKFHVYFRAPDGPTRRATLTLTAPPTALQFEAERHLHHQGGRADADGWSCNVRDDRACYMCFGPYTAAVPPGARRATFRMLIDNNTADDRVVVTLDVYDAAAGRVLAQQQIKRRQFVRAMTYQDFELPFTARAGQRLETRVYWHDRAYVRVDRTIIR